MIRIMRFLLLLVQDRHIVGTSVIIDKIQDWTLLNASQTGGYTIFKFTRPLVLCNPGDITIQVFTLDWLKLIQHFSKQNADKLTKDFNVKIGSPFLVWSFGTSDPASGSDISYHGSVNRGSKNAVIIGSAGNSAQTIPKQELVYFSIQNVIIFSFF